MKKLQVFLMATLLCSGCATTSGLKLEQVQAVKTIALVIEPYRNKPEILDHTQVTQKTYTGYQFGAIGGLVEGIILSVEASIAKTKSLGGNPADFLRVMKNFQIQEEIGKQIQNKLETGFHVISPGSLEKICKEPGKHRCGINGYLESAEKLGVDALIYLKYAYGLAAYIDDKASAIIDADLWIYDVRQRRVLLKKGLSSEEFFRENHTIDEFLNENGVLFKNNIMTAADGLSKQVAAEWYLFKEEVESKKSKFGKNSSFFTRNDIPCETISYFKTSCSWPVKLTKKCSAIRGAVQGIKINNYKAKIAATEDGKIILVMWGNALVMADEIKKIANDNRINILRAQTFGAAGLEGTGYILYTDGDLYSVLQKYFY